MRCASSLPGGAISRVAFDLVVQGPGPASLAQVGERAAVYIPRRETTCATVRKRTLTSAQSDQFAP